MALRRAPTPQQCASIPLHINRVSSHRLAATACGRVCERPLMTARRATVSKFCWRDARLIDPPGMLDRPGVSRVSKPGLKICLGQKASLTIMGLIVARSHALCDQLSKYAWMAHYIGAACLKPYGPHLRSLGITDQRP